VRFLFKPGWLALIAVVIVFTVSCYTLLAPWQFRRNREQQALNQAIAASYAHPAQPLATLVPPGDAPNPGIEWRKAKVSGHYLSAEQVLVRLRTVDGDPAYEVVTAFRSDDGHTIAVDRGYVRPDANSHIDAVPVAPAGPVTVIGRIRKDETDTEHRPPIAAGGLTQVYAASGTELAKVTGRQIDPGYLLLVAGQPGELGVLPLPATTDGPFLSYAWQWLSFGLMAVFGLGYFVRLELLQRRGPNDDEYDGETDEHDPRDPRDPAPRPVPEHEADQLVQRYGRVRF
jgi:cytochrome oxidase assembly protein ShyY1